VVESAERVNMGCASWVSQRFSARTFTGKSDVGRIEENRQRGPGKSRITVCLLELQSMARNRELGELARSLHRASERLWMRVANPGAYEVTQADIEQLQKSNTQLNRAITKLKRKVKR
jgi:hypothetical protein